MDFVTAPRCIGTLDGPVGDCSAEPVVVLVCFGVVDEDGQALAADDLEQLEPLPVAFCTCLVHKRPLVQWARRLWGSYGDGALFPVSALPQIIEKMQSDGLPTAVNPNPLDAYELVPTAQLSAG